LEKPLEERTFTETTIIVVIIGGIIFGLIAVSLNNTKYPKKNDKTPGNQFKRLRNDIVLLVAALIFFPTVLYIAEGADYKHFVLCFCWTALIACGLLSYFLVVEVAETMSADLLEHANTEQLHETMKNTWTNCSVMSALMLTVVAPYAFPFDAEHELGEFPGSRRDVAVFGVRLAGEMQHLFLIAVAVSITQYFLSMMAAAIHLLYTAALSEEDMLNYVVDNRAAPAESLVWFFSGLGWHSFATVYLIGRGHSKMGMWVMLFAVVISACFLFLYVYKASVWEPPAKAERVSDWLGAEKVDVILSETDQAKADKEAAEESKGLKAAPRSDS
jgi:hypothetical protein